MTIAVDWDEICHGMCRRSETNVSDQKLLEAIVLPPQLCQPLGVLCLNASIKLTPPRVGGVRHLKGSTDVGDGLAFPCSIILSAINQIVVQHM
jgi:hypothetical protein